MRKEVSLRNTRALPKVGFWRNERETRFPDPRDHVDTAWSPDERAQVLAYLDAAYLTGVHYFGWSECRFCGRANGVSDMTDGTFVFPEGFSHYLREHSVRPPDEFLEHLRAQHFQVPDLSEFETGKTFDDPGEPTKSTGATPPPTAILPQPSPRKPGGTRTTTPRKAWWRFWA